MSLLINNQQQILMNELCNKHSVDWKLWSSDISWETPNPSFTLCFEYTILNWIPICTIWLCATIYVPVLRGLPSLEYGTRGRRNILKSILIVLLLYKHLLNLFFVLGQYISNQSPPRAMFLAPILSAVSSVLLIYLNRLAFTKGDHSPGILFFYWLIQFIVSSISTMTTLQWRKTRRHEPFQICLTVVEFILVLLSFILNCLSDGTILNYHKLQRQSIYDKESSPTNDIDQLETSPEIRASYPSKLAYFWFTGLLYKGYRNPVTLKDLYQLRYGDRCKVLLQRFKEKWNKEILKTRNLKPAKRLSTKKYFPQTYNLLSKDDWNDSNDFSSAFECHVNVRKLNSPSLLRTLFAIVGYKYLLAGIVRIVLDLIVFLQPQLLSRLIVFIENSNDFEWHGYVIVLAMFIVSMLRTIIYQQYNHISNVTGMRLRSGLISFIYRKTLKLSAASRKNTTVGEIINLMSVDSQRFTSLTFDFHSIFSIPIVLIVGFFFLWQQLGTATVAGIILILCLIPINAIIGVKVKKLQVEQMILKDLRIKLMSEMLSGIKVFKLYAWERSFEERIQKIRNEECRILRLSTYMNSLSSVTCFCAPYLIALSSFAAFILSSQNNILDVNKAFVSLALVNILNSPMSYFTSAIGLTLQGYVSIQRINKFLIQEELPSEGIKEPSNKEVSLEIIDGTFSWGKNDNAELRNINMRISVGELIAVVGKVGSGKSSLINAILGEMYHISGKVALRGSVAYVPQQAWCQNASIMNNILFGKILNVKQYKAVLDACALNKDLEILCDGDQTEVGEKGINLSGGQKQRISMARAVYQDCNIYILDDPLSAVDAHVNRHIFDKVIGKNGILSRKTRILVTNNVSHLPHVDWIYCMNNGRITDSGTYQSLLANNIDFSDFVMTSNDQVDERVDAIKNVSKRSKTSSISESAKFEENQKREHERRKSLRNSTSLASETLSNNHVSKGSIIKEEIVETGTVKMAVFLSYIRPATYYIVSVIMLSYIIYLSSSIAGNVYLSSWSEKNTENHSQSLANRNEFLIVYGSLGALQTVIILIENLCLAHGTYLASKTLHANLLKTLLRVPNIFFETTPTGRILNRVGRDIDTVDVSIPTSIAAWMITAAGVIGTIIVISIATPFFIIAMIPLSILYYIIQKFYISTNRQLKRLDSMTRSPLYSHFQETITGVSSIRAYNCCQTFIDRCDSMIDLNQIPWYLNIVSFRWLQCHLEFVGNLIILMAGLFAVIARDYIGPGLTGLSVSYALQVTLALNNMVRNSCDLESHIVSVERIKEYTTVKEEAPWIIREMRPPGDWPSSGKVEFRNYSLKYRKELNFVLKDVSIVVNAGEKLGIVGRTGAGKSSFALALLRLIEPTEGSILIDDVDVGNLGLHDLRSRITIIPQDPVLLSGTIRMNLDPFHLYSDSQVWLALESAQLKTLVAKLPEGLSYMVSENGDNLSVGQKQLICLARALLKRTKLIIMDEATAAIDQETDNIIQNSIRKQFKNCTVLTIAHRLNTIIDYDRILVLENGQIKELGTPRKLMADKSSLFFHLAQDAGLC